MVYSAEWFSTHPLHDGTEAVVRLVRADDKPLFQRAASEFSNETMAKRFFTPKPRFSMGELEYLTEVDGFDHFAIVGVRQINGKWQGLAAARFVREATDPEAAEFAIIVGDAWQRCGLGTMMMRHLIAAAVERGVRRFKGDILATNSAAFHLIDRFAPFADWLTNGVVALVEFELPNGQLAAADEG